MAQALLWKFPSMVSIVIIESVDSIFRDGTVTQQVAKHTKLISVGIADQQNIGKRGIKQLSVQFPYISLCIIPVGGCYT